MAQPRRNLPLYGLRAFEAAARHLHIARAAEELGVTHSAVSHQIRALEQSLEVVLFDRRRKPLRLTAEGERLLHGVRDAFDRLSDAATEIHSGDLEGTLTISCVPGLAANWLVPLLGQFVSAFPRLEVKLTTEYWRRPWALPDVDLAIVYCSAEDTGKRVVRLGHSEFFPVCSPKLLNATEPIRKPADLLRFNLLHEYDSEAWSRWFAAVGVERMSVARGIFFDSAHLSLQAARSGYGIAMGDTPTVDADLQEGRLVRIFEESVPATHPYYLVAPPIDRVALPVRELESWIVSRFRELKRSVSQHS